MSEAPAYMLANLVVRDAAEYRKYEQGFFPILMSFVIGYVGCTILALCFLHSTCASANRPPSRKRQRILSSTHEKYIV